MPLRFYLPASGTAGASPTVGAEWLHANTLKRPLTFPKGSTTLSSTSAPFSPDAADHLGVDGDTMIVQYVSDPLPAQVIAAQTVKLAVIAREIHANNNLVVAWKLWIWTAAGTVGPTLLALRRDDLELGTSNSSRFDSATTTLVTIGANDRLVLDLGVGGNPGPDTTGTQGHNGAYRLGESGTTDSPESDGAVSLTDNPWLEFADDLFNPAPIGPTTRRAVVTWVTLAVPTLLTPGVFVVRTIGTALATGTHASTAQVTVQGGVVATAAPHATVGMAVARVRAQATVTATKDSRVAGQARVTSTAVSAGTHDGTAIGELLTRGRSQAVARTQHNSLEQTLVTTPHVLVVGRRGARAIAGFRGSPAFLVSGWIPGHQGRMRMSSHSLVVSVGVRYLMPRIPMQQLTPIDLGTGYRGDTMILPVWAALTREGEPYDLEGAILYFTAKEDLVLPDAAPKVIQCSTADGGITILNPPLGHCYRVQIHAGETQELLGDTVFTFDVQLTGDSANIYTIRRGLLTVVRDVTRANA